MIINIKELKRDREAGTDGPWIYNQCGEFGETIDCPKGYAVVSARWMGGSQTDLDISPTDARRIARLPDLEAAYIEAVERQEHQYHVGPLTFDRVFRAGQLENLYDMQAVLDAVERALEAE